MGFSDFWIQNGNGKEQLKDTKHGVRKEQVDKKFHNLFDAYDVNNDGTLESNELDAAFSWLKRFAKGDNVLDASENLQAKSIFAQDYNIKDADFQGFAKEISRASEEIVDSKETPTADGGKEIKTTYSDGTVETIAYYPDGDFKFKKTDKIVTKTHYELELNGQKREVTEQQYKEALKRIESMTKSQPRPMGDGPAPIRLNSNQNIKATSHTTQEPQTELALSERGAYDASVRDFVLSHYIETHQEVQDALDSMGILDDAGALINTGAGELWNLIKNKWNGTDEEYQNFYELVNKFEPSYNTSLIQKGSLDAMRNHPEMYFRNFETDFNKNTGHQFDLEKTLSFQQTTERYQQATIINSRLEILKKAMSEIRMYESEQAALTYAPAQNEGLNPASHIVTANKLLLQYFNDDQDAVNMLLNGTIGSPETTIKAISELANETEKQLKATLGESETEHEYYDADGIHHKTKIKSEGITYDQLKEQYQAEYKEMYGVDFVPDELMDKVMGAKATGGLVKIAAITIVSILITKSPVMTEIMGASAGSLEATGAAANFVRGLVAKYGQTVVQQGIKFAMTTGTLTTDVALTLLNQVTDSRDGVQWDEVGESTKSAVKYIYFGAYVGAPLAQSVARGLGKIGATTRLFEGGTKTAQGAITTTTISGDKLVQNFMKGSLLSKGASLGTEITAFAALDLATEDISLADAFSGSASMQVELKIMSRVLEYMLGGRTHTAMEKAKMDAAIERSGVKNWTIKEIKTPTGTKYTVESKGISLGTFNDANALATAMVERVSMSYSAATNSQAKETSERGTKVDLSNIDAVKTAKPQDILKPTEASTFGKEEGITFKSNVNPNDPPSNAYKIEWGKTVEETIELNQKNGVPLELVKDETTGEYFLGVKHSWDNEYYRVDRESIIVKYGEGDFAPVAEDNGAHIFTQTYLDAKTGQPIDVSKMKPGEPLQIVKNPNATVGAVAFDKPTTVTSLEGDMPNVEMARTDVDGHPYGNYEQLAKDIRKGKIVANESDPNSAKFIELVKAGKDVEAQALLKQASLKTTSRSNVKIIATTEMYDGHDKSSDPATITFEVDGQKYKASTSTLVDLSAAEITAELNNLEEGKPSKLQVIYKIGQDGTKTVVKPMDVFTKATTESSTSMELRLMQSLEQANDRESFVKIRDEIKNMPVSDEKSRLMKAYTEKYNAWSSNPARPDIRMQYIPSVDLTNIDAVKAAKPQDVMKPTEASTIKNPGITFTPNPNGEPAKAYRLIWCDTVEETIAKNNERGIPLELYKDPNSGEYKLGIKHSWDDNYFAVDRESAIVNYDYTAEKPSDWAVVAEADGAKIFSKTYLNQATGKTASLADIEPGQGMVIVKNPEATVGASAFEGGKDMTSLEEPLGKVDFTRTDVDGHPYGRFEELVKDINKGKIQANPKDPNSVKFVELVKAGKTEEARQLLVDATKKVETALASKPSEIMKPTEATTITEPGITFTPNPNGAPAKAYRLIWCDTVEETIARNNERGIPLELYRDSKTGEYKLGIKHSWDDEYFGVDRESAIVNYDYTAEKPSDWAVVAEADGAKIFSKTYLNQATGRTASLADVEPGQGMVIVKNPEATVGASAFEGGKDMTSLEEPLGKVDFTRTDVDGHPYGRFEELVKDINKGKIQANPKDPNSVKFVELVKAGKTEEARQLLVEATKAKETVAKSEPMSPVTASIKVPKMALDSPEFQAVQTELKELYKKGSDKWSKKEKDKVAELEYTIQAQGILVARSPIIQQSKISMIAVANPRDIFLPDFSNEAQLKEFGYVKGEDGKWHNNAKNKGWFPNALSESDVIYVFERDADGRPIDTGHGPAYELKQMYVFTENFDNDNMTFIDPATMKPGQIYSAKKCASGSFCILPVGTKIFSSEGLVEIEPGQLANIKEGNNSVHISDISKIPGMYKADPMNPASKKLFDKISEYKEKEATLTEQERIEAQNQIAETFGSVDRGQQLIDILGTGEQRPVTLREKFDVAARISKVIDEKYLSRIDCSNFDKGLEQAGKVMDEILADNTLNDAQKQAAIMGIMTHMVTATNLHQHGKGSTPKDVTLALAREKGLPESTIADIEAAYAQADKGYPVLSEFNRAYDVIGQVIRTPEDYKASIDGIIRESIKRGQLVCEIRCACDSLRDAATGKSLTPREGTLAIMKAIEDVKTELRAEGIEPPETSFVFLTFRGKGWDGSIPMAVTQAKEAVRIAEEHPDMKFGYDVAGPEDTGWGPKAFKEAMDIINQHNEDVKAGRKKGNTIGVTMHAGETPTYEGGEGYKSVLDAIEMGAVRIGHGIQLAKYLKEMETKNPEEFNRVLNMVKEKGITIEICGVCNIQSIPINSEGMEQHAIQTFLDYGIPVTICTDNDAICGTNISKEYTQFLLTGHSNFMDWNAIKQSVRDGVDAAFITDAQKAKVRTELDNRIARLQKLYDEKMNGAAVDSKKKGSTVSTQTENVGQSKGASAQAPREFGVKAETEVKVNEQARRTLNTFVSSRATDNALSSSRLNLSQYGKNGIPLKYTRESFIKDLDQLLSNMPASERAKIESEFGIKIENTTSTQLGKEIVGIPKVPKDIVGTPNEQAVARLIRKFTVENEVEIADVETKQLLESVLQTFPEFAMTVGKKQHGTHAYSVDVHTLKNLQDNLADPKYERLDAESQLVLKYATILHDIGKRFLGDKQPDHGHADLSTQYAKQILERFDLSDDVKARIIKQVEKHHWFEKYCKGGQSPEEIARVVETFDTMEDLTIAEIMAKSDYQNVNEDFHLNKWRNWVDGDGLMTKTEFDNYMETSFGKIENVFDRYSEDYNKCQKILDQVSKVEKNETQLIKYSNELLSYYRLTDGKCSPVVMETVNKINSKIVACLFNKNITAKLVNIEKGLKEHYKDGQIPESDYSVEMWEKDWNGNKLSNSDRTLNTTAFQTCAMIIDIMKFDETYLDSPSGIEGLTKRDLLINFSKYTAAKGTTGYYLMLAKSDRNTFENIMHSMLDQYKASDYKQNAATIYKKSSWPMNTALNSMYLPFVENGFRHYDNNYAFDFVGYLKENPAEIQKINELSSLIESCPLKHKSVTYRGGQLNELDVIRIDDGKGNQVCADVVVQNFLNEHPNATSSEIENFVFGLLQGRSLTKPRYMSATCNRDLAVAWATGNRINGGKQEKVKLVWKIHADEGAKALFMEHVNNMGNNYYDQFEFLFQRSTTLNFMNCHFNEETGILELEVKVSQPEKLGSFKELEIPNETELLTLKKIYNSARPLRDSNPQKYSDIQRQLYDAANELLNGKNDLYLKLMQDSEILKLRDK